jgi:hypothetical protein
VKPDFVLLLGRIENGDGVAIGNADNFAGDGGCLVAP